MPQRRRALRLVSILFLAALVPASPARPADLPVAEDPLVRLPGTQPGQVSIEGPDRCQNCHADFDPVTEPGRSWRGSMMGQAARDFIFWPALAVAAQDSQWALGRPNGSDLCLRCHLTEGWLEGRSDPTNAQAMRGSDFDGVHCDVCHRAFDPFAETTWAGTREGDDWAGYWDESGASDTPSQAAADETLEADRQEMALVALFDGEPFFVGGEPFSPQWTEHSGGELFIAAANVKRGPFADAQATHQMLYSRHHKSRYFCGACHDVSNPVFVNLPFDGVPPGDGVTVLPSEEMPAFAFTHVERTFSEFALSAYGQPGGAPGLGAFAPEVFDTSTPDDWVSRCQDCHLPDGVGKACDKSGAVLRPDESIEHPVSGVPRHDLVGGNAFVGWVLASAVPDSPNHDPVNENLLRQGAAVLTLDLDAGLGLDADALLAGVEKARAQLERAAVIEGLAYDSGTGDVTFRVQNQTGHKLISGFPEGRRMFVNVRLYEAGALVWEVNPYDPEAGTLKGLPDSGGSPPLDPDEEYEDELVYEMHASSTITGEESTFHFVLADGRFKDNRIPPKGFRSAEMEGRLVQPVHEGAPAPDLFTAEEYAGGYDEVELKLPTGGDRVEVELFYQTTSREYVEFLRDEINGVADTLPPGAYIIQTDPFFAALRAWGDTVWQLWDHNREVPGAAPIAMAGASLDVGPPGLALQLSGSCPGPTTLTVTGATPGGSVPIVGSPLPGSFIVPGGACVGTELGLAGPSLLGKLVADGTGAREVDLVTPESACGLLLQALDLGTCEVSAVVPIP